MSSDAAIPALMLPKWGNGSLSDWAGMDGTWVEAKNNLIEILNLSLN